MGSKEAKRVELGAADGKPLSGAQQTQYRALAACRNYLAMDRPDIAYASKELCRDFARPTGRSAVRLKRLVR